MESSEEGEGRGVYILIIGLLGAQRILADSYAPCGGGGKTRISGLVTA